MHVSQDHNARLRAAIALATEAKEQGNHPFGALLVVAGEVVLTAHNTVHTEGDETCHAESNLVSRACRILPREQRQQAILYTSTEPCAMCAAAIYWSGIRTVVFGCSGDMLGTFAGKSLNMNSREVFSRGLEPTTVIGPLLADEAAVPHQGFWRRNGGESLEESQHA